MLIQDDLWKPAGDVLNRKDFFLELLPVMKVQDWGTFGEAALVLNGIYRAMQLLFNSSGQFCPLAVTLWKERGRSTKQWPRRC